MARKTLGAQLNALHSERLAAVDVFTKAAKVLEETAEDYLVLAEQARIEAAERHTTAEAAWTSALDAKDKARKIRELVGQ